MLKMKLVCFLLLYNCCEGCPVRSRRGCDALATLVAVEEWPSGPTSFLSSLGAGLCAHVGRLGRRPGSSARSCATAQRRRAGSHARRFDLDKHCLCVERHGHARTEPGSQLQNNLKYRLHLN